MEDGRKKLFITDKTLSLSIWSDFLRLDREEVCIFDALFLGIFF